MAVASAPSLAGPASVPGRGWQREALLVLGLLIISGFALLASYQPTATYSVDISEPRSTAELEGVYLPEHNDQFGPYRWTPANITIHLRPIGAPLHVKVRLAGWRPTASGNPEVIFTLDGKEIARVRTSNEPQDIDLSIPRGQALLSSLDLQLHTTTFNFGTDPRDLGVVLMGVQAASGAEWPKPALPNGVVIWQSLLAVLMIYAGGRAAGWKPSHARTVAFGAMLLAALLFALDRQRYAQWTWVGLVLAFLGLALGLYWSELSQFAGRYARAIRLGTLPAAPLPEKEDQGSRPVPQWLPPMLVGIAFAMTLLHPLVGLLPKDTTNTTNFSWGLAYYANLPAWVAWGGVGVVFLFAIPQVNRSVLVRLSLLKGYVATGNPYVWLGGAGVVAIAFLWILHTHASLGDSSELLDKISFGSMWREREPLDYYIHFKLSQALAGWGVTPLEVYRWTSVLAGWLLVVGIGLVACLLAPHGRGWLAAGLGLATGNLLLFAGYVESYTFAALCLVWFLLACLLYARGSAPAAVPALIMAVALWLHPMTAFLLPALLAALLLKPGRWLDKAKDAGVMLASALVVSAAVSTIFLIEGYSWERWQIARSELGGVDPGMFKPLFQATGLHEYYPIFSWAHLGGIFQEQLRLAPLAIIVCIIALVAFRRRNDDDGSKGGWNSKQTSITIVAVAAVSTFIFSITWNPDLGASNDWDLLSLPGIPLSLLAGGLLALLWPRKRQAEQTYTATLAYSGSVLLLAAGWHSFSWLLANALGLPH